MKLTLKRDLPLLLAALLVIWGLWYARPIGVDTLYPELEPDLIYVTLIDFTGSGHEDQQHGVLQLLDEPLEQGGLGGLPQTVGAVLPQASLRLPAGKAGLGGVQVLQDLPGGLVVLLVHTLHSL